MQEYIENPDESVDVTPRRIGNTYLCCYREKRLPVPNYNNKVDVVMVPKYSIVTFPSVLATAPIIFIAVSASWM